MYFPQRRKADEVLARNLRIQFPMKHSSNEVFVLKLFYCALEHTIATFVAICGQQYDFYINIVHRR